MEVPCGQCIGCRIDRSRSWAIRCVHEAQLYDDNCFITLTYRNEDLPWDGSLDVKHFQDFMKRLRRHFETQEIRFFHCGEYGEKNLRPHYHACLFNIKFEDQTLFKQSNGNDIFTSNTLTKLWPFGFSTIGNVTWQSAGYCARYIMKKLNGNAANEPGEDGTTHYENLDKETGEIIQLKKEYTTMSRRPGLGYGWFQLYKNDLYPHDFVVMDGKKHPIPRYYDILMGRENPQLIEELKEKRAKYAAENQIDNTCDRLRVREKCKEHQLSRLPRTLEEI